MINKDNLESYLYRSFSQYKCHIYKLSFINLFIINLFSIMALLLFILIVGFYSIFLKNKKQKFFKNKNAILANKLKEELIPYSISNKYRIIKSSSYGFIIDNDVLGLLKLSIRFFWFEPYFILKSIVKVSFYSYLYNKYIPDSIIVCHAEASFTSSIITAYLEKKDVLHINIMHGEKLFNIRDSFFRFSEFWVWNMHYVDLFKKLYAHKNQFKIEMPPLHEKMRKVIKSSKKKILTYYWSADNEKKELLYIFNGLNKLRKKGFKIIIRYHPSYKEHFFRYINSYCGNFIVENPESKNIYDSLLETNYALATYSTVLLEASMMGRIPVINDYGDNIIMLEKLDYILVKSKKYITFSKLLKDYGCN